jgi:hypothetical protein
MDNGTAERYAKARQINEDMNGVLSRPQSAECRVQVSLAVRQDTREEVHTKGDTSIYGVVSRSRYDLHQLTGQEVWAGRQRSANICGATGLRVKVVGPLGVRR